MSDHLTLVGEGALRDLVMERDSLRSQLELAKAVVEAVAPLVSEWRPMPKFEDDVWQKRQDVVLAYDALKAFDDGVNST